MRLIILFILFSLLSYGQRLDLLPKATTVSGTDEALILQTTGKMVPINLIRGFSSFGSPGQYLRVNGAGTGIEFFSTITETKGGTGLTSYSTGDIIYASGTNTLAKLAAGTNGHVLTLSGGLPVWQAASGGGSGTVTSIATSNGITGGTITTSGTISGVNAQANASTKGVATYVTDDFNDNGSGTIALDYANGQEANSGQDGFLSSTDWSTFNGKQAALVSGTNIKTINSNSLLGSGNLTLSNLGATTVGSNLFTLTNPSAVRWLRLNADNTISTRTAAETLADLGGTSYTDEEAQDAIGAMSDASLVYNDATPSFSRAALTGAITASAGSNTTALGSFTVAQLSTAISDANISGTNTGDQTSIVGISGTLSEFNTALTGADFATGGGTVTGTSSGTNTGDQTSIVGISGTLAQFNTAVTDADLARTDASNTFTGIQYFTNEIDVDGTSSIEFSTAATIVALNGEAAAIGITDGVDTPFILNTLNNRFETTYPFHNTTFSGTFDAANGSIASVDLANSAVASLSGTNTGDQTITNSSDATSHTVTLSASGGTVQLIEGANITLTTGGTGSAGTVTIASTGGGGTYYAPATLSATATDADFTATANAIKHIPDGVATADRVITIPTGSDGDVIELYNNEDTYVWSLTGATVYLADRTTTVTELLYNVPTLMQKINGSWIIKN